MKRFLAFVVLLCGAALLGVAGFVYTHTDPDPVPQAAAIVVLSGPGADAAGTAEETQSRVDRGVALHQAGAAPLLVMSGGGEDLDAPDADRMAERATSLGVPAASVLREGGSQSTLQNALMTRALAEIDLAAPVVLVSHRYHLPRAWASFRWAGFEDITLVAADAGPVQISAPLLLEAVKWPVNLARAAGASAAFAAGAEEADVMPWLR